MGTLDVLFNFVSAAESWEVEAALSKAPEFSSVYYVHKSPQSELSGRIVMESKHSDAGYVRETIADILWDSGIEGGCWKLDIEEV